MSVWKQWFIDNCIEDADGFYIPPSLKRVFVETGEVYYDLEPVGDEANIKFWIDDPIVLKAYKLPGLVDGLYVEENTTFFIDWTLITDITLGWQYKVDDLLNRIEILEQSGVGLDWIFNEDISSQADGVNTQFELGGYYYPLSTEVIFNGFVRLRGIDYNEFGTNMEPSKIIEFTFQPSIADTIIVNYGKMDYPWIE